MRTLTMHHDDLSPDDQLKVRRVLAFGAVIQLLGICLFIAVLYFIGYVTLALLQLV